MCLFTSEAWVVSPGLPDELDRAQQNQLEAEPAAWPALHINIDMVSYGDHSHLEQTEKIFMAVLCHMNKNSIPSVTIQAEEKPLSEKSLPSSPAVLQEQLKSNISKVTAHSDRLHEHDTLFIKADAKLIYLFIYLHLKWLKKQVIPELWWNGSSNIFSNK